MLTGARDIQIMTCHKLICFSAFKADVTLSFPISNISPVVKPLFKFEIWNDIRCMDINIDSKLKNKLKICCVFLQLYWSHWKLLWVELWFIMETYLKTDAVLKLFFEFKTENGGLFCISPLPLKINMVAVLYLNRKGTNYALEVGANFFSLNVFILERAIRLQKINK